jgi:hypothetical protein
MKIRVKLKRGKGRRPLIVRGFKGGPTVTEVVREELVYPGVYEEYWYGRIGAWV